MRRFLSLFVLLLAACAATTTAPSLDRTAWVLADSSRITITFVDGSATGSGGCNQYWTKYTTSGSSLTFGPVASTKRACAEDDHNRAEVAYFEALSKTASYAVEESRLILRDATGATLLEFTPSR
jgi:heat shock protein HslJ